MSSTPDMAMYIQPDDTDWGRAITASLQRWAEGRFAAYAGDDPEKIAAAAAVMARGRRRVQTARTAAENSGRGASGTPGRREAPDDTDLRNPVASTGGTQDTPVMAASKAGRLQQMSNFLATDKVPDTLFGIPVVSTEDRYQEKDIAFFREHPEAGGYYDMGEDMV